MPVKWLALESIQHRIFTQKSDVWGFGELRLCARFYDELYVVGHTHSRDMQIFRIHSNSSLHCLSNRSDYVRMSIA